MFWRTESKSTGKSCRFSTWMEFVRQISMKLKTSSNEGLLMKVFSHSLMWLSKHCSGHSVTTQKCTLISWGCVHLRWCDSLEDYTLWPHCNLSERCHVYYKDTRLVLIIVRCLPCCLINVLTYVDRCTQSGRSNLTCDITYAYVCVTKFRKLSSAFEGDVI